MRKIFSFKKMLFLKESEIIPNKNDEYKRLSVPYTNKSENFVFQRRDYSKQFAHIYASRLTKMKTLLPPKMKEKWGKH